MCVPTLYLAIALAFAVAASSPADDIVPEIDFVVTTPSGPAPLLLQPTPGSHHTELASAKMDMMGKRKGKKVAKVIHKAAHKADKVAKVLFKKAKKCNCIKCGLPKAHGNMWKSGTCGPASGKCGPGRHGKGCYSSGSGACDCHTRTEVQCNCIKCGLPKTHGNMFNSLTCAPASSKCGPSRHGKGCYSSASGACDCRTRTTSVDSSMSKVFNAGKAVKALGKGVSTKASAKLHANSVSTELKNVKNVKQVISNCMALKVFAKVSADQVFQLSARDIGPLKAILTELSTKGNCLKQLASTIAALERSSDTNVKDSIFGHMLRVIKLHMLFGTGILVYHNKHTKFGDGSGKARNGLMILVSAHKVGLSSNTDAEFLLKLCVPLSDAQLMAQELKVANLMNKIDPAKVRSHFWSEKEAKTARKNLFEGTCAGAMSLMCGKYKTSAQCWSVGCLWRGQWSGKEAGLVDDQKRESESSLLQMSIEKESTGLLGDLTSELTQSMTEMDMGDSNYNSDNALVNDLKHDEAKLQKQKEKRQEQGANRWDSDDKTPIIKQPMQADGPGTGDEPLRQAIQPGFGQPEGSKPLLGYSPDKNIWGPVGCGKTGWECGPGGVDPDTQKGTKDPLLKGTSLVDKSTSLVQEMQEADYEGF